jgi:hypothetical protein
MRWDGARIDLAVAVALGCAGCDQLGLGPPKAASAPVAAETAAEVPDLRPNIGRTYLDFVAQVGMERYEPAALGLSEVEQARFAVAMETARPGFVAAGGGAEALVFAGCAASGCADAAAVVAIDLTTGAPFLGVRDSAGADEFAPNERVAALLRLSSPTRSWDNPAPVETAAPEARQP